MRKTDFVVSLGGSIAFQQELDARFLAQFVKLIVSYTRRGYRFVIVTGGGYTSRYYVETASRVAHLTDDQKDWLGIAATKLNAQLLHSLFGDHAAPELFDRRKKFTRFGAHKIIIGTGWAPGWSTDFVSTQIAVDLQIPLVVNLSKPTHVYTGDFERDVSARPLDQLTWREYMQLVPGRWKPGLHAPIDPVAARLAARKKIVAVVARGDDLANVKLIIDGKAFVGTTIR